ncbi:tRNA pseudouridine(55) synthase TruB, partial [Maribellus luteus]
ALLPRFTGLIEQIPPQYSAIKVQGERAYDLARDGETVELAPRPVEIHHLSVVEQIDADRSVFEAECGKGTYVRSIVRDLAVMLGACGHVSALRRAQVGPFDEDRAITLEFLEDLCQKGRGLEALLPVETALDDIPALAVTTEDAFRLSQGRAIVLLPRQVETLKACLTGGSRTVLATQGGQAVS